MFNESKTNLDLDQQAKLAKLLTNYQDTFAKHDLDLGCFAQIKHKIDTGDNRPVQQKMRRTPVHFQDQEYEHLQKLLKEGIIQPSCSSWSSAPVLVRKRDGSLRWCVDFRALNNITEKDRFPLPNIQDCLETLHRTSLYSTLDMASGYYQLEIEPCDRKKTAFITRYGLYEHIRMGFGLCNAPATFQRAMNLVLRGLSWHDVLVYLDDIVILGKSFEDSLHKLEEVFKRFRQYGLKLKPKKCELLKSEVVFLGRSVSAEGIKLDTNKVKAIVDWVVPSDKSKLLSFLGFASYHRDHIDHFAERTRLLYELAHSKENFVWLHAHQEIFESIKEKLVSAPCLAYPAPTGVFDTDASEKAIGAQLSQKQDGQLKVISYASNVLLPAQQKYCTTRKELLALVKFTRSFRHYLLG